MTQIKTNLNTITEQIKAAALGCNRSPDQVTLISVSKRKAVPLIQQGIEAGADHLGENYIQEAVAKIHEIGQANCTWHFIGHLQSNKARFAVPAFDYIHTVDSVKLAREINKQAAKNKKVQKILIQVNISGEETKSGIQPAQAPSLLASLADFENLSVEGLMTMPPFFPDPEQARPFFTALAELRKDLAGLNIANAPLPHLSMGMSNDFKVAIEAGATMVRVGTAIFGARD